MDDQIDEIMDTFDFEKLSKQMEVLQWKWGNKSLTKLAVPSALELRKCARRMLKEAATYKEDGYALSTGGFKATYRVDKDGPYLTLEFILMESYV